MSKGLEEFKNWLIGSSKVSESSVDQYVYTLRRAENLLGKPLLEAQESEINELLANMREGKLPMISKPKKYSDKYIKLMKAALKRFYKYHDSELADKIEVEFEKWQPPSKDKLLSKDDFETVLANAKTDERALILTLYSTGARVSEIVGNEKRGVEPAKIENLDLGQEIPALAVEGKGGKTRYVHFLLKRRQTLEALKNHIGFRETGPIFTFNRYKAWRLCKRAGDRVGVFPDSEKNLHPHMLRHMHATDLLLDHEFNIRVIQKDLGHSNLDITSGYLSVSPEDIRKEAEEKIEGS